MKCIHRVLELRSNGQYRCINCGEYKRGFKMVKLKDLKEYTKKDFEKYCEDNFVDEYFSEKVWNFIKDEDVLILDIDNAEKGEEGILTIHIKVQET